MTTQQILNIEFELIRQDLIKAINQKGMTASGESAESLEVISSIDSAKIVGNKNFEQLEYGRRAGKMPPISAIKQWIEDKGLVVRTGKKISTTSLAWAIAKKIQKVGWNRRGYGGVELVSEVITPERMQKIIDKVGAELALTFVGTLTTEVKKLVA